MIEKTEAIVLRIAPFSRTSHVVTWLTSEYGRMVTTVKGACRPKSAFLGQYDLYYTCEILFYRKEHNGLHILKECLPLDTRSQLRGNWQASTCTSYMGDLLNIMSLEAHDQADLYRLATETFDFCATCAKPRNSLLYWFELKLLDTLGMAPQLSNCASCSNPVSEKEATSFSTTKGGLLCASCADKVAGSTRLAKDTLSMLRHWQNAVEPRVPQATVCSTNQSEDIYGILGQFLKYHLDRPLESRYTALKSLAFK